MNWGPLLLEKAQGVGWSWGLLAGASVRSSPSALKTLPLAFSAPFQGFRVRGQDAGPGLAAAPSQLTLRGPPATGLRNVETTADSHFRAT